MRASVRNIKRSLKIFVVYGAPMRMLSVIFARNTGAHKLQAQRSALSLNTSSGRGLPGRTHLYITYRTRCHFKISAHINTIIFARQESKWDTRLILQPGKNTHRHADTRTHTHCTILHPSPGLRADSFVKVSRRGEGEWHCGIESSHRTLR